MTTALNIFLELVGIVFLSGAVYVAMNNNHWVWKILLTIGIIFWVISKLKYPKKRK